VYFDWVDNLDVTDRNHYSDADDDDDLSIQQKSKSVNSKGKNRASSSYTYDEYPRVVYDDEIGEGSNSQEVEVVEVSDVVASLQNELRAALQKNLADENPVGPTDNEQLTFYALIGYKAALKDSAFYISAPPPPTENEFERYADMDQFLQEEDELADTTDFVENYFDNGEGDDLDDDE
ncbi:16348_t:CDS:2, partial [Racocetra fulgida]